MTSTCGGSSVWSTLSFTCLTAGSFFLSTSMTVAELTRKTRTISRTPLPLMSCRRSAVSRLADALCRGTVRGKWCANSHDCYSDSAGFHWLVSHIAPHRDCDNRDTAPAQKPWYVSNEELWSLCSIISGHQL